MVADVGARRSVLGGPCSGRIHPYSFSIFTNISINNDAILNRNWLKSHTRCSRHDFTPLLAPVLRKMSLHVPTITENDLRAFHSKHLGGCPIPTTFFLGYGEIAGSNAESYDEDDDLGWYDDGVKRTLTDEQIAMFRHSEIQALLAERRHQREAEEEGGEGGASTELSAGVIEASQSTVVADTAASKEETEIEQIPANMTTELGNASEKLAEEEAESTIAEEPIATSTAPPVPTIPTSSEIADSPALTSTQTPSSAQPDSDSDSDGELPSDLASHKRKHPSNRNKQWRKRQKLKKQQKWQEKVQAEKAQEPEDFTPRRIAREQDEVVHANANVDLDYD